MFKQNFYWDVRNIKCWQVVHFYVVGAIHYYLFSHSWLIIGFITKVKRRIPLMRWELFILRSSIPGFSGIRVAQSLVFCVIIIIVDHFSLGYCIVCPTSIYRLKKTFWYRPTFLIAGTRSEQHMVVLLTIQRCGYNIMTYYQSIKTSLKLYQQRMRD